MLKVESFDASKLSTKKSPYHKFGFFEGEFREMVEPFFLSLNGENAKKTSTGNSSAFGVKKQQSNNT